MWYVQPAEPQICLPHFYVQVFPVTCSSAVLNMYFQSVENSVDPDQMVLLGAQEQLREKLLNLLFATITFQEVHG